MSDSIILLVYIMLVHFLVDIRSQPDFLPACFDECEHGYVCRYFYTDNGILSPACFPISSNPILPDRLMDVPTNNDNRRFESHNNNNNINSRTNWLSTQISMALNSIWRGERPTSVRNTTFIIEGNTSEIPDRAGETTSHRPVTSSTNTGSSTVGVNPGTPRCIPCQSSSQCTEPNQYCFYSSDCAFRVCQNV